MKKIVQVMIILSCLLLISSFASAQVIVTGKIYKDMSAQNVADGVGVTVQCAGLSKTNNTNSDGSYGFAFIDSACGQNSQVVVSSTLAGKTISQNAVLNLQVNYSAGEFYLVVSNLDYSTFVQPKPIVSIGTSGGGGSGRVTLVGVNLTEPVMEAENITPVVPENNQNTTNEQAQPTGLARITGAVIGTLGTTGTWIVILFVVGVVAASVAVRIRNNASKK